MSDRVIMIKDGKVYEVLGDPVCGYRDATGAHISGPIEEIKGDPVQGFRDSTGQHIRLREIKK